MTTQKKFILAKIDPAYPPTNARPATADGRTGAKCSCCRRSLNDGEIHLRVFSHQLYLASIKPDGTKNTGAGVTRICLSCAASPDYPHHQNKVIQLGVKAAHE